MIKTTLKGFWNEVPISLEVGPLPDNTYAYGFADSEGWILSEARYANAESAKHDARRPQELNFRGGLEPVKQ